MLSTEVVLKLQHAIGNRAVGRLLAPTPVDHEPTTVQAPPVQPPGILAPVLSVGTSALGRSLVATWRRLAGRSEDDPR
jgi:hypothetical protein